MSASRPPKTITPAMIDATAREFVAILRRDLTQAQFAEVKRRNAAHRRAGDMNVCASHDFIDANMSMQEAAQKVGWLASGDAVSDDSEWDTVPVTDEQQAAWNRAWEIADTKYGLAGSESARSNPSRPDSRGGWFRGKGKCHLCGASGAEHTGGNVWTCAKCRTCARCGATDEDRYVSVVRGTPICSSCYDFETAHGGGPRIVRPNPHLILVTGNPAPGTVEKAWCKFHQRDVFDGRVEDFGKIKGMPGFVFALGKCRSVEIDGVERPFRPQPWLVCSPDDDALWIVTKDVMNLGSDAAGRELTAITYDPPRESGKEPAYYRHEFARPLPVLTPVGNPHRCRAVILDGGDYKVTDWLHD